MTTEEIFDIWASPRSRWSRWVKPVLFAHIGTDVGSLLQRFPPGAPIGDISWLPPPSQGMAIVADLPGDRGVMLGIELARRGYRPVPLYNGTPGPLPSTPGPAPLITHVPVWPIVAALLRGATELGPLVAEPVATPDVPAAPFRNAGPGDPGLGPDAPPVFLLDSNRRFAAHVDAAFAGRIFDNRSVTFPTDFPSAQFLQASSLRGVLVVQENSSPPAADLAHTLRRWQDAGLPLAAKSLANATEPTPLTVEKPSWLGWVWYRALTLAGLRRSALGGFGGLLSTGAGG